jgi:hypothetical protein
VLGVWGFGFLLGCLLEVMFFVGALDFAGSSPLSTLPYLLWCISLLRLVIHSSLQRLFLGKFRVGLLELLLWTFLKFLLARKQRKFLNMDYREVQELHRVLRRHEEFINNNRTSIFLVTTKIHENERHCISHNVVVFVRFCSSALAVTSVQK